MRQADKCFAKNPEAYRRYMAEHFCAPLVYRRIAYELIARLPFLAYVTINFDPMLQDELYRAYPSSLDVSVYHDLNLEKLKENHIKPLFYLHGKIEPTRPESADNLVLGFKAFELAYARRQCTGVVSSFLHHILKYHDVVFFGCGLDEPLMNEVLLTVQTERDSIGLEQGHFALLESRYRQDEYGRNVSDIAAEEEEDTRLRKCGITSVRYNAEDRFHSAVENILGDLAREPEAEGVMDKRLDAIGRKFQ